MNADTGEIHQLAEGDPEPKAPVYKIPVGRTINIGELTFIIDRVDGQEVILKPIGNIVNRKQRREEAASRRKALKRNQKSMELRNKQRDLDEARAHMDDAELGVEEAAAKAFAEAQDKAISEAFAKLDAEGKLDD